jgi:hypothetical protein
MFLVLPSVSSCGVCKCVVPPDILDYPTSTDMVVREGTNVTLRCAATGSPEPTVTWRREGGEDIPVAGGHEGRKLAFRRTAVLTSARATLGYCCRE